MNRRFFAISHNVRLSVIVRLPHTFSMVGFVVWAYLTREVEERTFSWAGNTM